MELMYPSWDPSLDDSSKDYLRDMDRYLGVKLEMVNERIKENQILQGDDSIPIGTLYQSLIMNSTVPSGKQYNNQHFMDQVLDRQVHESKAGIDHPMPISMSSFSHTSTPANPQPEPGVVSAANLSNHVNLSNLSECAKIGQLGDISVPTIGGAILWWVQCGWDFHGL